MTHAGSSYYCDNCGSTEATRALAEQEREAVVQCARHLRGAGRECPIKGWAIVDAGWMAMSRDRGTAKQAVDQVTGSRAARKAGSFPR